MSMPVQLLAVSKMGFCHVRREIQGVFFEILSVGFDFVVSELYGCHFDDFLYWYDDIFILNRGPMKLKHCPYQMQMPFWRPTHLDWRGQINIEN